MAEHPVDPLVADLLPERWKKRRLDGAWTHDVAPDPTPDELARQQHAVHDDRFLREGVRICIQRGGSVGPPGTCCVVVEGGELAVQIESLGPPIARNRCDVDDGRTRRQRRRQVATQPPQCQEVDLEHHVGGKRAWCSGDVDQGGRNLRVQQNAQVSDQPTDIIGSGQVAGEMAAGGEVVRCGVAIHRHEVEFVLREPIAECATDAGAGTGDDGELRRGDHPSDATGLASCPGAGGRPASGPWGLLSVHGCGPPGA